METNANPAGESLEIQDLVKQIAKERIAPHAPDRDISGEFPWECIRTLAEAGLMGAIIYQAQRKTLTLHFKTSELLRQDIAKAALGL
ncbi:MAG: acyl-CoA dehydrogenase family protein [Desulfomonile tiedjei]|nr:acyl-CoA dehydrogenase family protein [Desulfomonile tiedjei]